MITAVFACRQDSVPAPSATATTTATTEAIAGVSTPTASVTTRAYPAPAASATTVPLPTAYPPPSAPTGTAAAVTRIPPATLTNDHFLPFVADDPPPETAVPTSIPTPTPIPALDFAAIDADLEAQGQDLAYVKFGFHAGIGGTMEGLEAWMRRLDAAGVPLFIKTADNAEPVFIAQELRKQSGVPHTLVYRKASGGDFYNVPNYELPPVEAARIHWQLHIEAFPPELDPNLVWLETINEVDKNRSEWLAEFALETAGLALRDGYKWAAFGWASGEPEPEDWQSPAMLEFLRLVGNNPDRLAIALHEYSFTVDEIGHQYPYKVGRFQELFRICDQYGIPRPTVLITEWGWTYETVPSPPQAMADIAWAARLYAAYPNVKGAAIWFLGGGYADIAMETQALIYPLTLYSLQNYFVAPPASQPAAIEPERYRP